jgi:Rrf2 family protein
MKFTRTTEYALRTLVFMARSEHTTYSCSSLHRTLRIPNKYLQRILTDLTKRRLVKSDRGRSGGYRLGRSPSKIFLFQIIDAVEGFQREPICFFGFDSCPLNNPCAMHDVWAQIQQKLVVALTKTRLSDLTGPRPRG